MYLERLPEQFEYYMQIRKKEELSKTCLLKYKININY